MENYDILLNSFSIFTESKENIKNLKSLVFQLALNGKLDFQKLSKGRIKKSLQTLIKEQKQYLKKAGIAFQEKPDNVWPMIKLEDSLEKIKYTNKIKKSAFLKEGTFPIVDQSENFISGYWNKKIDVFKIDNPIVIFGDHTCCFKYIDFDFVLGADGVKIIQPKKQFLSIFLYYLLSNTKIRNLGYSRHFKALKKIKIPLPPLSVQKEIISLMEKCTLLESQVKKKYKKQEEFSQSITHFISHSRNKTELSHHWKILKDNFKEVLYSKTGARKVQSMIFQLALNGKLDFQKLSKGRINKPLQTLIEEQKQYLKKTGITFEEEPDNVWPMVRLGEICKIFNGSRPKGGAINSGVLSIGGEHISLDGSFNLSKPKYIPKKFFNKLKRGELKTGDVLIVKDGATTGKTGYFGRNAPFKIGAVNEHVFILRSDIQKINSFFLYQIMKSEKGHIEILKRKKGTAQGGINLSIKEIKIPLPSLEIQKEIVALMEDTENTQKHIQKEKNLSNQLSQSLSHLDKYQQLYNI